MKPTIVRVSILVFTLVMLSESLYSQGRLLRRLQEQTEERIINEIVGEPNRSEERREEPDRSDRMDGQNRRGAGLDREIPDVNRNITEAGEFYESKDFIGSKTSVRNALWGIELEIGQKVLASMPNSVEGLDKLESEDQVSSMGAGFVGLIIARRYEGRDDVRLDVTIGNDSAILGVAGLYMYEGMYVQEVDQPDVKQIRFQEHRAHIRYDDYDGYTLSVPFGQSSVFMLNGKNFDNESQFMAVANQFSMNTIKKELGDE